MSALKGFEEWAQQRENCLALARHWDTGPYTDWNTRLSERAYLAGFNAGLEAAAKVCEDDASAWSSKYGRDTAFDSAHIGALERIAAVIRALKE